MKNKLSKKFAALALSTAFVVTGIAGVVTLNNNAVNAATLNAYEVANESLSKDIQDIITALKAQTGTVQDVYYVQDKPVNGEDGAAHGNVSGIRIVLQKERSSVYPLIDINTTSLTYDTNTVGLVIDEYMADGASYIGMKDATANVTNFVHLSHAGTDTATDPKIALKFRQVVGNSGWKADENIYDYSQGYGKAQVYTTNNDPDGDKTFEPNGPSRKSLNNVPFNFKYDNASNALYGDTYISYKFIKFLNVKPSEYANYSIKTKTATLKNSNYTASNESQLFAGYTNNQATIAIRADEKAIQPSIVLTSLAGLDLTSATNAYSATTGAFSIADKDVVTNGTMVIIGEAGAIPKASMVNPVTYNKIADATYTVNVYSGTRSSKQGVYGSNGYAYATLADDPNLTLVENNVNLDTFAFATAGAYTLEYVSSEGDVFYVDINAATFEDLNPQITANFINAKVYNGDTEVLAGDRVSVGTVLTVKPNEGFTLFGFQLNSSNKDKGEPQALINGEYVKLTKSGNDYTFTVQNKHNANGSMDLTVAAYEKEYVVTLVKEAATNDTRTIYLYKGISSFYYDNYNWNGITGGNTGNRGTYYNNMHYDGEKLCIFGWMWGSIGKGAYVTMDGATQVYKTGSAGDYNKETGETSGNFKVNGFEITSDATIKPCLIDFTPVADSAKMSLAGGKLNVSVEFSADKAIYEEYVKVLGGLSKLNLQVVIAGKTYFDNNATDAFHFYNNATKDSSNPTILAKGIEASEVRGDKVIFKVTLTGLNDSAIKQGALVFGLKYTPYSPNGGVGWYSNGDNHGFAVVDFKTEIEKLYNQVITTEEPVKGVYNAVEIDGVTYYAKYSTATIQKLVKYYKNTQV